MYHFSMWILRSYAGNKLLIALWLQPLAGEARQLDPGTILPTSGTVTVSRNGTIVLIGCEPQGPDELYCLPSVNALPQRLTDYSRCFITT